MTSRPAQLGAVYAALMAAHDLADHVVQTDHQAAVKATSWRAMAGHVGGYHAVQLAALAALRAVDVRPSWWRVALGSAWSAGTHALLDRRWPVRRILEMTGSRRFATGTFEPPPAITFEMVSGAAVAIPSKPDQPIPLHGPYLADQALHHTCLLVAALIIVGGRS